jgi:predicted acylesterase/phospholipase RssA
VAARLTRAGPPLNSRLPDGVRLGVVLSAGGLRGVAHLGVMRALLRHDLPIDVIVGVSAGAIIAGYYAGVGLTIDEMIGDAPIFKGRHVALHGLMLRAPHALRPLFRPFCGVIPRRLTQLHHGRFDRLHHGISDLGIVCHDLVTDRPVYFSSATNYGIPLSSVVKASAAVPGVIPTRPVLHEGRSVHLVDGGLSDSLPIAFARETLGATRLIVSDCRFKARQPEEDPDIVYLRPELHGMPSWRSPAGTLIETVQQGEATVTPDVIDRIRAWLAPNGCGHADTAAAATVQPTD